MTILAFIYYNDSGNVVVVYIQVIESPVKQNLMKNSEDIRKIRTFWFMAFHPVRGNQIEECGI